MSSIQIIGAGTAAQREWLYSRVAESREAGRTAVLYVPEQYTLQAERDLLTALHLPGLLNLDVISPTKLKVLVRERAGATGLEPLDEAGRAMAMHKAIQECGEDLIFYRRLSNLYGTISRMDQTLSELREEGLTPDLLDGMASSFRGGAQRAKYQDLSRIWHCYDALLADRFDDPADAWRDMCVRLPQSGLWRGADLYVYGFDTVRPDLRELLIAAAPICHKIHVLLSMTDHASPAARIFAAQRNSAQRLIADMEEHGVVCTLEFLPTPLPAPGDALGFLARYLFTEEAQTFDGDPGPALTLYAAPDPVGESLTIASTILDWHRIGISWNRMAIALPRNASDSSVLLSALRRNGIPFFLSRREQVSRHGVSRLLSAALLCVSRGYETESLLEIASCGFGVLSREEGAVLTSYVRLWGIERGQWQEPFTLGEKEQAHTAELLRRKLLAPVRNLHDRLRRASNASASTEALFLFLREEGIDAQLQERQDQLMQEERFSEAIVDRQLWDLLMSMLDRLHALLGGRRATLKETAALMIGALERATLSTLPEAEEGVSIGQIGHMLPGQIDALVLPGLNDGVMNAGGTSLLSDPERRMLEKSVGHTIGIDSVQMGRIIRSDFVRTMSQPAKRLFVSFQLRDESGTARLPGAPVTELRRLFPDLKEQGGLSAGDFPIYPNSPTLALEGVGPLLRMIRDGKLADLPAPWPDAFRSLYQDSETRKLLERMISPWLGITAGHRISSPVAVRLFHGDRVSISRLECFAGCPRQHFLRYGLRPRLPRTFELTAGDIGDFFHLVLQEYINLAVCEPDWPGLPEERISALMDGILNRITETWEGGSLREEAAGLWQSGEYLRRARHAASILTRFAANADFQIVGTEMEFGSAEGMPPLILRLTDGTDIALQGKIDRLDLYRGPEGDYLRVLDLKSSEKSLDPARMDRGEQLQLMIYLSAAEKGMPGAKAGGALYFPIQDKEVRAPTPESAEDQRLKNVQLRGVVLAEPAVLRAMDRDISPYSLPKILNQDGSIGKSVKWALPSDLLRRLMDAALARAAELCELIRSGDVTASPSVGEHTSPCTFCEFAAICPRKKEDERPLPKDFSFEDVGRKGENPRVAQKAEIGYNSSSNTLEGG